tara:strand:+ start:4580 stop:4924 length:345 start_codon:yes stop_codon:yes gene_type:complete
MKKLYFCFFLKFILFFSCQKSGVEIISQDKMVNMLVDLSIIKSINNLNYQENQLIVSPEDFFILQKYNIDSLNWELNKNYYSQRPKILAKIYSRVQDSIQKKIDSLKNLKKDKS